MLRKVGQIVAPGYKVYDVAHGIKGGQGCHMAYECTQKPYIIITLDRSHTSQAMHSVQQSIVEVVPPVVASEQSSMCSANCVLVHVQLLHISEHKDNAQ